MTDEWSDKVHENNIFTKTLCIDSRLLLGLYRALEERKFLMIIFLISHRKPYVVTPHLNCLVTICSDPSSEPSQRGGVTTYGSDSDKGSNETVQMRDHKICFNAQLTKDISNYHHITILIITMYSLLSRGRTALRNLVSQGSWV